MTPEGRRRVASAIGVNVRKALELLVEAQTDMNRLVSDIGIRPPVLVTLASAAATTRTAEAQLEELLGILARAKQAQKS